METGRRRRRRRPPPGVSLCVLCVTCVSASSTLSSSSASGRTVLGSSSSSSAGGRTVLGRDREWWLDTVHLDEDFSFDGSHADFAQQFYRLFLDGTADASAPVEISQLDAAMAADVDARLRAAKQELAPLDYDALSPLLQRALLWDLGIVPAGDVEFTQILTTCGLRMAELAVSQAQYEAVGCTAQACSTPTGELYFQSLQCNGFQINNASRCLATSGKTPIHASMWSNGGDEWTLPEAFVAKHEWTESPNSYVVYAIHLQNDPNKYGKCVAPSMTVPCIAAEKLDDSARGSFCKPKPSRLVTQWIRAETTIVAAAKSSSTPSLEIGLSIALAAFLLLVVAWWVFKRRRERKRQATGDGRPKNTASNDVTESEEDGAVSYFFTDESVRGGNKRRGIGLDPHGTAVLGASFISGFEKVSSFRLQPTGRVADDSATRFGQRDSASLAHEDTARGCGAVYAGLSGYDYSSKRDRNASVEKSDLATSAVEIQPESPTYASNSSTYVSTNSELVADPYGWSALRHDGTSSSASSQSFASEGPENSSPLCNLLHDRTVMAKRVPYIDVSVSRQLSKGAYGEVWVGRMRDKLVAVKRLVPERRTVPKDLDIFIAEIRLMAQFEHPNVMALLGVAWSAPSNLCMMMEFLEKGDLKNLLKSWPSTELTWKHSPTTDTRTERQLEGDGKKTAIAIDVANGLRYLHNLTPRIVHRDLKSHNILLSQDLVAKLCDFGVSRVNEGMDTMTCGVGTAFWTAPEVLVGDKYTETADVYSFGVVLTELDSHQLPFHDAVDKDSGQRMETMHLMHLVCLGEISPSVSALCPDAIRALVRDCMDMEPSRRPTLDEIVRRLKMFSRDDTVATESERLTGASAVDSTSELPSSRRRTRLSSSFSIHDNGDDSSVDMDLASDWHADEDRALYDHSRDMSSGSIVMTESPRDSEDSESGAVWI